MKTESQSAAISVFTLEVGGGASRDGSNVLAANDHIICVYELTEDRRGMQNKENVGEEEERHRESRAYGAYRLQLCSF